MRRTLAAAVATAALAGIAPATAAAVGKPGVSTGGATAVKITTATLNGRVNPNGLATAWFFQYGTTKAYSAQTPGVAAGQGTTAVAAHTPIGALAPNTTYHFRLVAHNAAGTTAGADHTFKTPRQPLGLSLAATPNPVGLGRPTVLAGTLAGTGNARRPVQLQQKLFPFTAGFTNVGNAQLTNAKGGFAFPLLSVPMTAQYRVLLTDNTAVASPIVTVGVQVIVGTRVTHQRVRRGARVHFSGSVWPAVINTPMAIQKLGHSGRWVTISGSITRPRTSSRVVYGKTIRIRRGGSYRVYVGASGGQFAPNVGRTIVIHTFR
ncbi:MAG TPA: hypothetical protein VKB54_13495 [Solirubrobacteraceae bacterium]|nr:hypothetical protein [Solirubrobacteraceae bacterium]